MNGALIQYINCQRRQPYNFFTNNCWHKSKWIVFVARLMGLKACLVFCIVFFRVKCLHGMPVIAPHFYSLIEDEKIDVAFDPALERKVCRNEEIRVLFSIWKEDKNFMR